MEKVQTKISDIFSNGVISQIGDDEINLVFTGQLARTYLLQGKEGTRRFLKVQDTGTFEPLEKQVQKLKWLEVKLPIPRVLYYECTVDREYMITAEIPGVDAAHETCIRELPNIIGVIARGLKMIHKVSIEGCPFDNSLKSQLRIARENFIRGRVDSEELLKKFGSGDVEKNYEELLSLAQSSDERLVLIHGDFSMPNVVIKDNQVSGFLDMGSCGMADPYYDLAIAEKSIIRNYGQEYVELFYREYGIDHPDRKKVKLYQLLECFVYA